MKKPVAAVDFGLDKIRVLIGFQDERKNLKVRGAAEVSPQGFESGRLVHEADAADAVWEALEKAVRHAGVRPEKVYFNLDEPNVDSVYCFGTRRLGGEGLIQASDVAETMGVAERFINHFERRIVYSSPVYFLIDGRDPMTDPVGVSGRELTAKVHFVTVSSERFERWQKIFERAFLPDAVPVLSLAATCWAMLAAEEKTQNRFIVDAGSDFMSLGVLRPQGVAACRIFESCSVTNDDCALRAAEIFKAWHKDYPDTEEILVTGDRLSLHSAAWPAIPTRAVSPAVILDLNQSRYASLVGLLGVALETKGKRVLTPTRRPEALIDLKSKVSAFLDEYF